MREWQNVLDTLKKNKNPLFELYKDSQLKVETDKLIFTFQEEEAKKKAEKKRQKLQNQLPLVWQNKRIEYVVDEIIIDNGGKPPRIVASNPLQALSLEPFDDRPDPALQAAVAAERHCAALYKTLTDTTRRLATVTVDVSFPWRLRVGGLRGFRELILPALHPLYGVPYIPASSLKGVIRAWGREQRSEADVARLLGTLEGIGAVQIFDAFPTGPCLDVDITTPQWHWEGDRLRYQPEPHALLSLLKPSLKIGLAPTGRGTADDVAEVRDWVKPALTAGLGSRISSGYGRIPSSRTSAFPHHCQYDFELWTQGMYGIEPPSRENRWKGKPEFRPTAVRGMLRYWFRAIALAKYPVQQAQELEAQLFGSIAPEPRQGSCSLAVDWLEDVGDRYNPHLYEGSIYLEAKTATELRLLELLLQWASHTGGVGRGARRPLHWNDPHPGLRGCYWALDSVSLPCDRTPWQELLQEIRNTLEAISRPQGPPTRHHPGQPKERYQDVLDEQARLFLVPTPGLLSPSAVENWSEKGSTVAVRGEALDLLYGNNRFKGENPQGEGNANVGGGLETPSYVLIQSNFPTEGFPYQAVTIFGGRQRDRAQFAQEIAQLDALRVL